MSTPKDRFITAAKDLLGPSGWREDAESLDIVSTPWRGTYKGSTPFLALPATTEKVSALVRLCAETGTAIVPQGGNTGLVDGGTPYGEVCVSLRRMQDVRNIDPLNNSMTIEAGAPLVATQSAAENAGRFFPLSLGSEGTATIGGLISTNAGGVAVLRYGMMRDLLLGLEVVMPNGDILDGLSGLRKNNTGYDLKHLFAGAEGTLGIITAATLKLFPRPQTATAWLCCETPEDVVKLLSLIRDKAGDTVTSFEIIPKNAIEMVTADTPAITDPLPSNAPWRVLCEISLSDENQARETLESALAEAYEAELISDALIAASLAQSQDFWRIRESIPLSKRAYGTAINHDVSVPVSEIPKFLTAAEKAVHDIASNAEIVAFGHVGDGNLHYSACEPENAATKTLSGLSDSITAAVHKTALAHGGSISAEHGVGRLKRDELEASRPQAATTAMRAIKRALDPQNIMNPGRVISFD